MFKSITYPIRNDQISSSRSCLSSRFSSCSFSVFRRIRSSSRKTRRPIWKWASTYFYWGVRLSFISLRCQMCNLESPWWESWSSTLRNSPILNWPFRSDSSFSSIWYCWRCSIWSSVLITPDLYTCYQVIYHSASTSRSLKCTTAQW